VQGGVGADGVRAAVEAGELGQPLPGVLGLGPPEFLRCGPGVRHPVDLGEGRLGCLVRGLTRQGPHVGEAEGVAADQSQGLSPDGGGQPALADDPLVQASRLSCTQDGQREVARVEGGSVPGGKAPGEVARGGGDGIVHARLRNAGERGELWRGLTRRPGRGGNPAKGPLDSLEGVAGAHVADDADHGVVGTVVLPEEVGGAGGCGCVDVGHRADGGVAVRVIGAEDQSSHLGHCSPVGDVVVALPLLLLDDLPLGLDAALGEMVGEGGEPIGLQPQREVEGAQADGLEVVRPVEPGGGVDGAAEGLEHLQVLSAGHVR